MRARIEHQRFHWQDPEARAFYGENGFVVVHGVMDTDERAAIQPAWDALVAEAANATGLVADAFVQRFPQNRDLWTKSPAFDRLLRQSRQGAVAAHFLGSRGVRLFHDHAIAKPAGRSSTIPWHQDSSYWPLDRVGNSLWTPTATVGPRGGCLKVLAGSHRDGPGTPQDFLRDDGADRDDDPRLTLVPVEAGETVILDGLTWHGSDPNDDVTDRLAYLTLWVPSTARFTPQHASWHPQVAWIDVAPGERLSGRYFPLFGELPDDDEGRPVAFTAPVTGRGPTMFKGSESIRRHLRWLTDRPDDGLATLLQAPSRELVIERLIALGLVAAGTAHRVGQVLDDLRLQEAVRERFVARDVYLTTIQAWWHLVGHQVEAEMERGRTL